MDLSKLTNDELLQELVKRKANLDAIVVYVSSDTKVTINEVSKFGPAYLLVVPVKPN